MTSRFSVKVKPTIYSMFAGLSSSMGEIAMENPEEQRLVSMDNTFNSVKGYISNEAPFVTFGDERRKVTHLCLLDLQKEKLVYSAETQTGVDLACTSTRSTVKDAFLPGTPVSSAIFNRKSISVGHGQKVYKFDGFSFQLLHSRHAEGARYVCTTQNRVFFAGFDSNPNRVSATRVNMEDVFPEDEAPGEPSVLKAAFLQIDNMLNSSDRITGLGTFESNRLAIFTSDRALVYTVDPDFNQWRADNSIAINYGTISHNSIVTIGGELFFCSRSGVHSIRRSALNGITIFTLPLSDEITDLYQSLIAEMDNTQLVSACYNPDEGRLHVFIPTKDGRSHRLSVSIAPSIQESQKLKAAWSMATSTSMTCGTYGAGRMFCGTTGGIVEMYSINRNKGVRGNGSFTLPILFQKDVFNPKTSHAIAVIASGSGLIRMRISDETERDLGVVEFELPDTDDAAYNGVPLQRQFIREFRHKFVGLRIKTEIISEKQVRIYAIGVFNKEE